MEYAISKIIKLSKSIDINYSQSLYLLNLKFGLNENVLISNTDLLKLVELDLVNNNQLTTIAHSLFDIILSDKDEEITPNKSLYPRLSLHSGNIVKDLAKTFLKNLNDKEHQRLNVYVKNPIQVPFLFIFLELFPTADKSKNKVWNEHFETDWDNVTLRRISPGSIKKFNQIWKSKDIGLFLLGTYMFIVSSRNDNSNKYFIKSLENYFKEYEYWYNLAQEKLDENKVNSLSKKESVHKTNTNLL
jgi:hypothetical protein